MKIFLLKQKKTCLKHFIFCFLKQNNCKSLSEQKLIETESCMWLINQEWGVSAPSLTDAGGVSKMLLSPRLWGAHSHIRKSSFLVRWHHVVLTGQAQLESGKQGVAGAQPVQGVVTRAAPSSLGWRGWGPRRAQLGCCQQCPWNPPVLWQLQREGVQSQQTVRSTLGSPTGLFFFSRVSFYSRSPRTALEAVPTGTSWVPYPLIEVVTAALYAASPEQRCGKGLGRPPSLKRPVTSPLWGIQTRLKLPRLPGKLLSTGMRSVLDPWRRRQEGQILKLLFPESL